LGAVLSLAFDRRLPILEANSLRVLCRVFGRDDDPRSGAAQRWLWAAAEAILPAKNVGDFNQALMELGALICTRADPACGHCPLTPSACPNGAWPRRCCPPGSPKTARDKPVSLRYVPAREEDAALMRGALFSLILVMTLAALPGCHFWERFRPAARASKDAEG